MNVAIKSSSLVAAAAVALGTAAIPAHAESFMQWAPVVRVTPVYTHVSEPRQQCWTERVTTDEYVDRYGVPLGPLASGITGSPGMSVAPVTRNVDRCRTIDSGRDVIDGYDVTYRYQNREFTTRLAYDPGNQVQVRIDVAPGSR